MSASALESGEAVLLFDIPRETYAGILAALGKRRFPHTYRDETLEVLSPVLHGISWIAYEEILESFGDRHFCHTYQNGALEFMMSPSREHERIKILLQRIVHIATAECEHYG